MEKFDDFIMVDWSASSSPSPANPLRAKDSIWLANLEKSEHFRTRFAFLVSMRNLLKKAIKDKKRILCGFDFSFGLPAGSVAKMREAKNDKSGVHDWHWLWHYLNDNIKDNEKNRNNRFEVASEMNKLLSGGKGPFWGCPNGYENDYLSQKKDKSITGGLFKERRLTEGGNMGLSVWQLAYTGAVGSQSLLGMAYLYKLRFLSEYESNIRVFPFENCDTAPVVFAESYYGRTNMKIDRDVVPLDKGQVEAAVRFCAERQANGELSHLLSPIDNPIVSQDEGWTFTEARPDKI